MGRRRDALCREIDPAADARSSLARTPGDARTSAASDRPARLWTARSAQRVQGGSVQPVRGHEHPSARGGDVTADAGRDQGGAAAGGAGEPSRSEEHTSELQSRRDLVCRLLLEKKKRRKEQKS